MTRSLPATSVTVSTTRTPRLASAVAAPRGEGEDRSIAKAVVFGETSHLEAVRDRDALEPKLIAQEAGHELRAERRRPFVDRRDGDVALMIARTPESMAALNGSSART